MEAGSDFKAITCVRLKVESQASERPIDWFSEQAREQEGTRLGTPWGSKKVIPAPVNVRSENEMSCGQNTPGYELVPTSRLAEV